MDNFHTDQRELDYNRRLSGTPKIADIHKPQGEDHGLTVLLIFSTIMFPFIMIPIWIWVGISYWKETRK